VREYIVLFLCCTSAITVYAAVECVCVSGDIYWVVETYWECHCGSFMTFVKELMFSDEYWVYMPWLAIGYYDDLYCIGCLTSKHCSQPRSWVYRLLSTHADRHVVDISFTVCLFVRRILVTDISSVGWRRAMKFCRMVDLWVYQVFSPFGELWPSG